MLSEDAMSDTLTEIMRELEELRTRMERMEALEFVRSQDTPTLAGLNVGTASGAPTGEVRASGGLRLSGAAIGLLRMKNITVNNNANAQLTVSAGGFSLIFIMADEGSCAIYECDGGINRTEELADGLNRYTVTVGTASSNNIYWSAANSRYEIENKTGATRTYYIMDFAAA